MSKDKNDAANPSDNSPIFTAEVLGRRLPLRRGKSKRRRQHWTAEEMRRRFAACPRCSFFLAAYERLPGSAPLETAVSHVRGGWLTLSWSRAVGDLVYKAYGSRNDQNFYYYESLCPECQRAYICWAATEEKPGSFHITI
jgi:hypothetical protein